MAMAHRNFMEAFRSTGVGDMHRLKSYFQPKLLLDGRSPCSLEFPGFAKKVGPLKLALAMGVD
jgi:hypothetical protein